MKYLATFFLFFIFAGHAVALSQSGNTVRASSQSFSRADNADLSLTSAGTLELWVYFDSLNANVKDLIYKQEDFGSFNGYRWYMNSASTELHFTSQATDKNISWTPTTSTWYHVAVTWSGGTVKFYIDGTQTGGDQTGFTDPGDGNIPLTVSGIVGIPGATNINGNFALVRVWNIARTQTEIDNNKCIELGATTGLKAEWTLDNTLADSSGNGYSLTNNNSATFESLLPACFSAPAASEPTQGHDYINNGIRIINNGKAVISF